MTRHRDMVAEFHRVFLLPTSDKVDLGDLDTQDLRLALIEEEWIALRDALIARDPIEVADALADILYVTYGAALVFGIDIDGAMSAVHRSNMTKLWSNEEIADIPSSVTGIGRVIRVGPDASIVYTVAGKVVKSPSWTPPLLAPVIYKWHPDEGRYERQG